MKKAFMIALSLILILSTTLFSSCSLKENGLNVSNKKPPEEYNNRHIETFSSGEEMIEYFT